MPVQASNKRSPPSLEGPDSRGDRTRKSIKRSVARLAERKDLGEISLFEICRAAKVTSGALYFHFKGKDEAIEEMVVDELTSLYQTIAGRGQGLHFDKLAELVLRESTRFHRDRKMLAKAIQVVINTRPRAYEAWIAARRPLLGELGRAIADVRRSAGLGDADVDYLAVFTLNAMEDVGMDAFQWANPTLAPYVTEDQAWIERQRRLWSHAVLAPLG